MTEQEWLTSTDPEMMLQHLQYDSFRPAGRPAIFRPRELQPSSGKMQSFVEAVTGISAWANMGDDFNWNEFAVTVVQSEHATHHPPLAKQADLLRDIFGNPFRPIDRLRAVSPYTTGETYKIAQGIYDDRAWERMPILADYLEENGLREEAVLRHLRERYRVRYKFAGATGSWGEFDTESQAKIAMDACVSHFRTVEVWIHGPHHVRGCWVIDLLLGKV